MITLARAGYGATTVRFPYDKRLVDLLKIVVPRHARTWDNTAKVWIVDDRYVGAFASHAHGLGHGIVDQRQASGAHAQQPGAGARESWADRLFAAVGPERAEVVHKALTRILHPDLSTGSVELQQELNVARDRLPARVVR